MIDNEKPLVLTEREFKQLVEVIVDNKFLEYIDYFRAEQEKSIQMAQQNQEYREQQVKQAQIDILDRVMTYINNKIENDYGDMSDSVNYLTIDIDDFDDFIDELIKEVQNETV